jgi:valyl-tRNA synthetase
MASSYNPTAVEAGWYSWWEKSGFFKPEFTLDGQIKPEGLFVLPAPPPNVTGILHNGHALTISIQDAIVRWSVKTANGFYFIDCCNRQRMLGKTVLFNPGYDHAGISTQAVVEKWIYKATELTRHHLGREKFLEHVWAWKEKYASPGSPFERILKVAGVSPIFPTSSDALVHRMTGIMLLL